MIDKKIFKKNPRIVVRKIEDETILMPLYRNSKEIDCIYTLNEDGAFIWNSINGKRTVAQIKKMILKEFETTEAKMERHLTLFFNDLVEIKAIK